MKKIIINSSGPLRGHVSVGGSKNAALPIIFSCILTKGVSVIENIPLIGDVLVALDILTTLGAKVTLDNSVAYIDTTNLHYEKPSITSVGLIRASTYLLGSCLGRFGICHIMPFGGCNFSQRPIDLHISSAIAFGGVLQGDSIVSHRLSCCEISLAKPSVGATVNSILLAVSAEGESVIHGAAIEPHIDCLIDFLLSCGASISRSGCDIYIRGTELHGGRITIVGDMIETGSYLALGLLTDGDIWVDNCPVEHMSSIFDAFTSLGADIFTEGSSVSAGLSRKPTYLSVTAEPYPGFPTDMQPILAPLMAKFCGGTICDTVWPDRFGYLSVLSEFGLKSDVKSNRATIYPSSIHTASVTTPDLRGGFACLMTAISQGGQSIVYSAETILRGYANLENKLSSLGADVKIY